MLNICSIHTNLFMSINYYLNLRFSYVSLKPYVFSMSSLDECFNQLPCWTLEDNS